MNYDVKFYYTKIGVVGRWVSHSQSLCCKNAKLMAGDFTWQFPHAHTSIKLWYSFTINDLFIINVHTVLDLVYLIFSCLFFPQLLQDQLKLKRKVHESIGIVKHSQTTSRLLRYWRHVGVGTTTSITDSHRPATWWWSWVRDGLAVVLAVIIVYKWWLQFPWWCYDDVSFSLCHLHCVESKWLYLVGKCGREGDR